MRTGRKTASDLLPPLAGIVLVLLFTSLGFWQLDRAQQKRDIEAAFSDQGEYREVAGTAAEYSLYQPMAATGRWLAGRQFLIDNAIQDGRLGYFVITPFEYRAGAPLLLVNRGWLPKQRAETAAASMAAILEIPAGARAPATVRGRAGQLPRVGIRAGEAFTGDDDSWPRVANWPTLDELAEALDRRVLPFVLLADPEANSPFIRNWQPREAGPMRHVGYAFQWFALAAAIVVLALVLYRKERAKR